MAAAQNPRRDARAGLASLRARRVRRRSPPTAEGLHARAARLRRRGEPLELGRVAVEDRRSAGLEAEEDLRLRVGDRFERAEIFDMDRRDGGDQRRMRADHAHERRDLAGDGSCRSRIRRIARRPACARASAARPSDCCRRRPRRASRRSRSSIARSISLALVLPTEPVTATIARARARPRCATPAAPSPSAYRRPQRPDRRAASASARSRLHDRRRARRASKARGDVIVAVVGLALDGEEEIARMRASACRSTRPRRRVASGALGRAPSAVRQLRFRSTARSCRLRQSLARLVRVAEGEHRVADDLPDFVALARRSSARRPSFSIATPARIASARSPISSAPGAAARIAARIAAGFSERGLSSVTITTSARTGRDLAHDRPLSRVAVAAAAERRRSGGR